MSDFLAIEIEKFQNFLTIDCPPRIPIMKWRYIINLTKSTMFIFCLVLMYLYDNYSLRANLYLAIHGTYGIVWILKDLYFPDKSFDVVITLGSVFVSCMFLTMYYCLPYTAIAYKYQDEITMGRLVTAIVCYVLGVFFMVCADAQKTFTLRLKKGLISDGLFSNTRNPNYFGEILIYLSFAIICQNTKLYLMLLFIWTVFFGLRMFIKDNSLKKKDGAEEYFRKSYLLFPKIFENVLWNFSLYATVFGFFYVLIQY